MTKAQASILKMGDKLKFSDMVDPLIDCFIFLSFKDNFYVVGTVLYLQGDTLPYCCNIERLEPLLDNYEIF